MVYWHVIILILDSRVACMLAGYCVGSNVESVLTEKCTDRSFACIMFTDGCTDAAANCVLTEMDEDECDRRKTECMDDLTELSHQFCKLKDQ